MNNFQNIVIAIFLAFFVFAVLIFSGLLNIGGNDTNKNTPQGKIVIWGTFSSPDVYKVFDDTRDKNPDLTISYVIKKESEYQQDLIEAFAAGTGPDLFIISPDMVQKNKPFINKIPFASYPQKNFTSAFIDGASVYIDKDGIIGLPLVVDPIVLYYNKDLLSNEGLADVPHYWDELFALTSQLTKKTDDGAISQSTIGLGRFDNVHHAKDILATLLLQNGNAIVSRTADGYTALLRDTTSNKPGSVTETVLNFFTEFSSPSYPAYSWNRSLPDSRDMFTSGKLALYIGRASELFTIQSINPNLSFDVAPILQTRASPTKRTYGEIYALAVNKKSANSANAFQVAGILTSGDSAKNFAIATSLPPASRTLLSEKPTDPYVSTFYNSAIITRTWLDPDTIKSDGIFAELIQNILSNKLSVADAVNRAQSQLESIIKN